MRSPVPIPAVPLRPHPGGFRRPPPRRRRAHPLPRGGAGPAPEAPRETRGRLSGGAPAPPEGGPPVPLDDERMPAGIEHDHAERCEAVLAPGHERGVDDLIGRGEREDGHRAGPVISPNVSAIPPVTPNPIDQR